MRALPYVLIALGALLIMAGFAQMPLDAPVSIWSLVVIHIGGVLATSGCILYWAWYERRPLAPAWDGPPRTIVPPVRPRR